MSDIVYRNEDWIVYRNRMETADGSYTIQMYLHEKREKSGLWDWPLHMADKNWFNIKTFTPAFFELLKVRGIAIDSALLMTFYKLGQENIRERLFDQAAEDINVFGPGGTLDFSRASDVDAEVKRRLGAMEE